MTKTIKQLCETYGLGQMELARKYGIPRRTVQDWHAGRRTPPDYVVNMLADLLARERDEVYLIYWDSIDDGCELHGYLTSEDEADRYCEEHNSKCKYSYEEITYERLEKLQIEASGDNDRDNPELLK